jgi:hypothetical protein
MTDFRAMCEELVETLDYWLKHSNLTDSDARELADRRPKPPSLKDQALEQLDQISTCFRISHGGPIVCDKILRALEALPNG